MSLEGVAGDQAPLRDIPNSWTSARCVARGTIVATLPSPRRLILGGSSLPPLAPTQRTSVSTLISSAAAVAHRARTSLEKHHRRAVPDRRGNRTRGRHREHSPGARPDFGGLRADACFV